MLNLDENLELELQLGLKSLIETWNKISNWNWNLAKIFNWNLNLNENLELELKKNL